jgi:predicted ATP-dependent protease
VIEQAARIAGDAEKVSTHMRSVSDLIREADHWAGDAGKDRLTADDVQRAIDGRIRRAGRLRERVQEQIRRGSILIDTDGARTAQVNGLSVMQLGELQFGFPTRITARVRLGRGDVVDIEREVELGGPIHSKGVLILGGFLGGRFAADRPLSLRASLVFEQSYGGVEGDSASLAELCALLSALSGLPIRQGIAITGSVNQLGAVQPIGGVNEKIEGFFDVCAARGLTGEQGVVIPAVNRKNLMLRRDVVAAAEAGQFHVYAVESADEAIELLTGREAGQPGEAGEPGKDGAYPPDSVNGLVEARLITLAERAREYGQESEGAGGGAADETNGLARLE